MHIESKIHSFMPKLASMVKEYGTAHLNQKPDEDLLLLIVN